ncbi:MAG: gliding motility-associated protein GldE [Crocinitomicaceae bacterium]
MNSSDPSSQSLYQVVEFGFSSSTLLYLLLVLVLLFLAALMSGSESAFFSLKPAETDSLKKENTPKAKMILELISKPKELLATLLIIHNFVNVGVVILSTFIMDQLIPTKPGTELTRFLLEVVGITFLILLTGEVIPKIFATRNSLRVVNWVAYPLNVFRTTPPVSWIKVILVKGSFFIQKMTKSSVQVTTDELEQALALTKEDSDSEEDHKILEGIVRFGKTEACQIMTPRVDLEAIDAESNIKEVFDFILEAGYSRIPVYEDSQDNVIGILYIKDLLPFLAESEDFDWKVVLRKPFFIPENKKINDLLQEFRKMKMHMAIVVDEYGGASGIVTLEDILEEIVGEITDEFDENDIPFVKLDENTYNFEGRTSLNDFYKIIETEGSEFESIKGDAETLGGFIVEQAGRIMRNNEFITISNYKMIVVSSDKKRIRNVKVVKMQEHE